MQPSLFLYVFFTLLPSPSTPLCSRFECNCTGYESRGQPAKILTRASCLFQKRQRLEFEANNFPESLGRVEIAGGKDVRFGPGVFSRLPELESVVVRNVSKVFVQKGSFANLTTPRLVSFRFADSSSLVLEEHSFRNTRGPVSAYLSGINQVIVQRAAFAWLADLTISSVPKLELLDEAFILENPKRLDELDEPTTTITLENVFMESLGRSTFHSPVQVVRIIGSEIKRIKPEAFSSMYLRSIIIENTTIHRLESDAFSSRTLVKTLTLHNVRIHEMASNALLSGLNNLAIQHSKLGSVHSGALNVTVASVTLSNNIVSRVFNKGFNLKDWNSINIVNNTFKWLEREAFTGSFLIDQDKQIGAEYNLSGNALFDVAQNAFDFDLSEEVTSEIGDNVFHFKCHCDMKEYVKSTVTGLESSREALFETSLCGVDRTLSQCFHLPPGFRNMANFTESVCTGRERILCEEVQRDAAVPPYVPSIVSAVDHVSQDKMEREKKVLGSIFLVLVSGMLLMTAMSGFMWLRRKGYCTKARLLLLPSTNSLVDLLTRIFSGGGTTPTGSISRLSVHEYAELQRKAEEGCRHEEEEEEEAPLEDKATQTLPEELTQELLQSLREKLDDPDNYKEARDMIEHLYDLIKVEESCNRNDHSETPSVGQLDEEEELYDVIEPRKTVRPQQSRSNKNFVSTGTRAPSPDKLLPLATTTTTTGRTTTTTLVCDYVEPRDRRHHLYTELPNKPQHLSEDRNMLCDYGEPTDTAVHLYTELPTSSSSSSNINNINNNNNKMANRPLPSKPDQNETTGGPSTSK